MTKLIKGQKYNCTFAVCGGGVRKFVATATSTTTLTSDSSGAEWDVRELKAIKPVVKNAPTQGTSKRSVKVSSK